jgi:DNA-binding transcriptional regulator YhcF (GntR family)
MKPIDYRNETFEQVKGRIDATRAAIWHAMQADGRALTTREIAALTGIDLLTVRPRVTELVQLGFAVLAEESVSSSTFQVEETRNQKPETRNSSSASSSSSSREGRYRALSNFDALRLFEERSRVAREPQLSLAL